MASLPLTLTRPISPWLDIGAYKWWTKASSFKTVADLFREKEDAVPSDSVLRPLAEECAREASELLSRAHIKRFGIRVFGTGDYPMQLRDPRNPIEFLYFQGWDRLSTPGVAVVGTREPTDAGRARTEKLVRRLMEDNYTIVSGLAAGIDTVAHKTAIQCKGRTIAVIGTPPHSTARGHGL